MEIEQITKELNKRFAEPLKEYYERRVIFWYDPDKEFADEIDNLQLANAKILALTGKNNFAAKLTLHQDTQNNYLVYCPLLYEKQEDNWLLDVELYSEEFRADVVSIWMNELHIPNEERFRKVVQAHKKFFNAKERRNKFAAIVPQVQIPQQINYGVMAVLVGCREAEAPAIIKAVLCNDLNNDTNTAYQNLVAYNCQGMLHTLAALATGYSQGDDFDILGLARYVIVAALSKNLKEEYLNGLEDYYRGSKQAFCYDLVAEWMRSTEKNIYFQVATIIEVDLQLPERLNKATIKDLLLIDCLPCVNQCILQKLFIDINHNIIDIATIRETIEARRTLLYYDKYAYYYDGLQALERMQDFYLHHAAGFHEPLPEKVWQGYCSEYYKMDGYYIDFYLAFRNLKESTNLVLDDLFKQVAEFVDNLYNNWFLPELNTNWTNTAGIQLGETGRIDGLKQQIDFYRDNIADFENRIFVIISDAMRYEVAARMSGQLAQEMQCTVKMDSCQGIFPTITPFGMAALLPHNELTIEYNNDRLSVLADGIRTDANYREKILRNAKANSVAISADYLLKAKRNERKEMVKGTDVVYIYHDVIDGGGHDDNPDTSMDCINAIREIKNIIHIIVSDVGGTNIIVTSDHGFMYNHRALNESDKVDAKDFKYYAVDMGRRYAILRKDSMTPQYLLKVNLAAGNDKYDGYAPREGIRIKSGGKGTKFVHGGISLQEMVIPVLRFTHHRNSSATYRKNNDKFDTKPVALGCSSIGLTINNPTFSLNFYQKDAVSNNRTAEIYKLYFIDKVGRTICQPVSIIADKTSENIQERQFRPHFILNNQIYDKNEVYYLVIEATSTSEKQKYEFRINIAFEL